MALDLTPGAPLWNGSRMSTVTSDSALINAGKEIRALGFRVAENLAFGVLDDSAHSSWRKGGWHYAYNGRGAIDINWTHEGANSSTERMLIDLYVIPILRKYGIRGILWRPRNRTDHQTWCHADRGSYNDYTVRSYTSADKQRAALLIAKYRTSKTTSTSTSTSSGGFPLPAGVNYAENDGTWRTRSGANPVDRPNIKRIQAKVGATQDGLFGPKTTEAVKRKQSSLRITADGKVGPTTWSKFGL